MSQSDLTPSELPELIDPDRVERFIEEQSEITCAAREAFRRYSELTGDKAYANAASYGEMQICCGEIEFSGRETWAYGGEEWHSATLPLAAISDPSWWEQQEREASERRLKAEQRARREREKQKREDEKRERAEFERLREKFGGER